MGNVTAIIPDASTCFMSAGHMDEIGRGDRKLGSASESMVKSPALGVIGRKAIQTLKVADTSQTPSLKDLWIGGVIEVGRHTVSTDRRLICLNGVGNITPLMRLYGLQKPA
jgi:hypothetical protein